MTPKAAVSPRGRARPVTGVVLALLAAWYLAALLGNWNGAADALARAGATPDAARIAAATMAQERPVVPAPHQVFSELSRSIVGVPLGSKRNLLTHAWVTLSATLTGFAIGALLGIALAIAIVHLRSVEASLMPWIVASQTVPILAVAPIIIVALGAAGVTGLLPKAVIAAYLCFFPVTVGMVKGLNAPDRLQRDLMRTYSASRPQVLTRLRWPAALPYLFASLKIAVAASLVGTIVAELPTGAQAGLGARLLAGSYYGQTVQIWAALIAASVLSALLVQAIGLAEAATARALGTQPAGSAR
ncbi:ABC transporter permease [Methylobacterium sp. Leaf123]|uniref:ABC transporter permease n=1 Tax=Methylobacterium sp. Leaf123 TaxID=1736264 RepID=UPI0006F2AA95|nr:ABC transporter permease [Methylobacterium sp. Leaf123]KQQ23133.1 ABC transporter permease [Methylobacterium sp. Leaf123]